MWRWLKLLTGWHMRDWLAHTFSSLPLVTAPQVRSLRISWKKNGLEFDTVPVLGTADGIIVRAELRYASSTPARKADLRLRVGRQNVPPESLVLAESAGRMNVHICEFHLEPLECSETVELCWQGQLLCQAALPVLPLRQFVEQLQLVQPTLYVTLRSNIGINATICEHTVPCSKYPRIQGRHVLASAQLISPIPLVGLLDCQPVIRFHERSTGQCWEVPLRLSAEQLQARQALVTVQCPVRPCRLGSWKVEWRLLQKTLASCDLEVRSMRSLHRYVELVESYFLCSEEKGNRIRLERRLPKQLSCSRVGPCFLLRSRETGFPFLMRVEVFATPRDGGDPVRLASEEILISDAPTAYVPGTLAVHDLSDLACFELRSNGYTISHLPISPVPSAKINAEGAIESVPEDGRSWSRSDEEELNERLKRLMESP